MSVNHILSNTELINVIYLSVMQTCCLYSYVVMLMYCCSNLLVDSYLCTRCTYNISVCKIETLDPENEVLHDIFGHVVDEI